MQVRNVLLHYFSGKILKNRGSGDSCEQDGDGYLRKNWGNHLILQEGTWNKELAIAKGQDGRGMNSQKCHEVKTQWRKRAQVDKSPRNFSYQDTCILLSL